MRATRVHVAAAAAIVERDLRLMLSYRLRPLALVLAPIATVTLFYYVSRLVRIDAVGSSDGYFAYVVVGIVGLTVLTSTLATTPATLRQEMVAGTLERLVVCPFGAVRAIIAMLIFPLAQSLVVAFTTVASAALVFGMPLAWPNLLLSPPAAILGAIAFAPFGVLALAAILVIKQTLAGVSIVLTGLSIFAGVYFPVSLLPDWIQWGADVQPFTPALDLLRQLLVSDSGAGSAWLDVAKLLGFTAVLLPLSVIVLQRALSHGRLRGTITEY